MTAGVVALAIACLAAGLCGCSWSENHDAEIKAAEAGYGPLYEHYAAMAIADMAVEPGALEIGARIFAATCARCHGAGGRGTIGIPDLTDQDWLFAGTPEGIEATILSGRIAMMPALAASIGGEEGIAAMVAYVRSLGGHDADPGAVEQGRARFASVCAVCHGADAKGNKVLGAPDLTDDIWLFAGTPEFIADGLRSGRSSQMPGHAGLLGERQVHLVAAYVYSLSLLRSDRAARDAGNRPGG
ncbi:MAG: c-type cytochrome [Deltaproteobacteria bacterium]|nr:c-type cytochrome [Deltaproteobacteria bacterium]